MSESNQDAFILFRLYDSNTNQTIKFTTLYVAITKGDKTLITDFFQSAEGLLKLNIQPDETASKVTVCGNREGFLDALVAGPQGTINVKGPIWSKVSSIESTWSYWGLITQRRFSWQTTCHGLTRT